MGQESVRPMGSFTVNFTANSFENGRFDKVRGNVRGNVSRKNPPGREGYRSPSRCREVRVACEFRQVVDCASPLALCEAIELFTKMPKCCRRRGLQDAYLEVQGKVQR